MSIRPMSFNDIKGHPALVAYFKEQLENKTLPQFILLEGEEGLGKTSLADLIAIDLVYGTQDSPDKEKAKDEVINKNRTTANIKKYRMSVNGGKDVAKEVLQEFNTTLVSGNKVLICDECHGMSDAAQDVLLTDTDTGRIPKGLYIIFLTTEISKLKPQLRSRAVPFHLNRLKESDMLYVLQEEVARRNLNIQGGDATLSLIASWAEFKPRTGLSILSAFADNSKISANTIKELIGYLEVEDVLPLVTSLNGSLTWGLDYINSIRIDSSFVEILVELLKVKMGGRSYKLRLDEMKEAKIKLQNVPEENILQFVCMVAGEKNVTKSIVISAFIKSHVSYSKVCKYDSNVVEEEKTQKSLLEPPPIQNSRTVSVPTIEDILANSSIISD